VNVSEAGRPTAPGTVVVVGTGLIGTSIALALRARGATVWLSDADDSAARLATDLGAGQPLPASGVPSGPADLAVLAVPPAAVGPSLAHAQRRGLARCYTDVASVKELPLERAGELGCDLTTFVPGHPMSGRERSGPAAARADLFAGRTWIICPAPQAAADCIAAVTELALACEARPITMPAAQHDQWVALISHVPHMVAAAMAGQCLDAPHGALGLAGPGLRDVTRIAGSDPGLWAEILTANATRVRTGLQAVISRLQAAAEALGGVGEGDMESAKHLLAWLEAGRDGVARLPGKQGGPALGYVGVQVVIPDKPGELARLFTVAGAAGINIEDVRIEHSPGLPVGVAELSVRPEEADALSAALAEAGWPVTSPA
jgi:prephenate dehydrogenase